MSVTADRYLRVSEPPASGDQKVTPNPNASAIGIYFGGGGFGENSRSTAAARSTPIKASM
ncbi:hypothetical protein [Spirosoma flavum]|uniref:Uncharacterized protein n=1 Tax=Spirosoma flavum TaxID=2048557 RepID=A0ABW6AJ29_9BACT